MLIPFASQLTTVTKCNPSVKFPKELAYSGRVVTVYQIGEQFGNAYKRTATGEIAAKGFRAIGLFPFDKNIF